MFSFKLEYKWCKINYMGKTTLKEKKPHFLWYDKVFQSVGKNYKDLTIKLSILQLIDCDTYFSLWKNLSISGSGVAAIAKLLLPVSMSTLIC